MNEATKGFTLIELLVVIALTGILAAIALPSFTSWMVNLRYRESARGIASTLRDARAKAIGKNMEHRVEFDISKYRIAAGNRPYNSSVWDNIVLDYIDLPTGVEMKSGSSCDQDADINIEFNPDGSSGSSGSTSICIMDVNDSPKYKIRMASTITGRIVIE